MGAMDVIEAPAAPDAMAAAPPSARKLSVVEYAVQRGATVAEVKAMLELQVQSDNHQLALMQERRRMEKEDQAEAAKRSFDEAMTKFRAYNVIVPKTKLVKQTARDGGAGPTFMQSEFDVVCRMLSPALSACGFSFRHDMRFGSRKWTTDGVESDIPWVYVTCFLAHQGGHAERLDLDGPPDTSGKKNPLQEMQSAASYLKRQGLLAITGTATGGEDDESRLRPRGSHGADDGHADEQQANDAPLLQAGRDASLLGIKALNEWWGKLTSKQRNSLNAEFGALRRAAMAADAVGATK